VTNAQEPPLPEPDAPASEVPPAIGDPLHAVASESNAALIQALMVQPTYAIPGLRLPQGAVAIRRSARSPRGTPKA